MKFDPDKSIGPDNEPPWMPYVIRASLRGEIDFAFRTIELDDPNKIKKDDQTSNISTDQIVVIEAALCEYNHNN